MRCYSTAVFAETAINRLVHYGVILELNIPSYRLETDKR